jgi:cytochrome c oxidase cbb3-type subunit 4
MDIGMIRGLGTVVVMVAFVGLALWVFSPRRKSDFDEATLCPADDPKPSPR